MLATPRPFSKRIYCSLRRVQSLKVKMRRIVILAILLGIHVDAYHPVEVLFALDGFGSALLALAVYLRPARISGCIGAVDFRNQIAHTVNFGY
jgi:hypothetical protein